MLRRLEWIKNNGIFEDYRWDSSLPELARINVIYGSNGSGKTSLAGAFDGLRNASDGEGHKRFSAAVEVAGVQRVTAGNDDSIFDRVHVFSEYYVARSHKFTPAEAEMDAVLTIGEKPVDAEAKLEALLLTVASKTEDRDKAAAAERAAKQLVETAFGQVSQQVVDAASRAGGRWRSRSNFNAGMVRAAFRNSHSTWVELTEQALKANIGIINSNNAEALSTEGLVVGTPDGIQTRLASALSTTPTTIILDTLAAHPAAASWVDTGRHLHAGVETCIFCGSSLTLERRALIDQHFSDEVQRLQTELRGIIGELDSVEARVATALTNIPSKGLLFEDLRPRYDAAAKLFRSELMALNSWSVEVRGRAKTKAANVLSAIGGDVVEPPIVSGVDFITLLAEHNERVDRHDQLVQESAKAVELHYLKAAEASVKRNAETAVIEKETAEKLSGELSDHGDEITTLRNIEGDPMPSAKVLTDEVARLLGRNELKFEAVNGRYRVTRDGEHAIGLSVGERTAITLIHFLESVARFDASKGKPIVIIDDPVSSLDSDIFMGVSTYLWTEAVAKDHIAQIILLSHDFELYRQWDIQVEALHRGGKKFSDKYPASFYEIRSRHVTTAGKTKRRPVIAKWPPSETARKMIRSTYHHAFMAVAGARLELAHDDSLENRLNAQLLFPNVIRRMLETFLAFKRPEWVGNFNNAMRESAKLLRDTDYQGDADALRLRLTRYAHAHSHSETPATDTIVNPDEIATAITSVFEFMNCLDSAHFKGLCEVVGIDPALLLPPQFDSTVEAELESAEVQV